ncbi:hypothetical protein [Flavobacterium fluviatile]|uniref:hypothetical protein n=1 Tax=Flavobacterium fluviatile TaxID=1862387 RepID=UPI0013D62276|nr:hypothetical protein [Flavobacterium fluviatile]
MKKLSFIVFIICFVTVSCSNEEESQDEDFKKLEVMHDEIVALSLSTSQACTNPEEWDFTRISASSCGGENAYVIYSKKIDKTKFLVKVNEYLNAQIAYNQKWKIILACQPMLSPPGIECVDGKPKFVHSIANK